MKNPVITVDEIELGDIEGEPSIVAIKGRIISKHRIPELDKRCKNGKDILD